MIQDSLSDLPHDLCLKDGADPAAAASILVVDDIQANRDMLSRLLMQSGHKVQVAADGHSALTILSQQKFALVLLDVMMPDMSGLEVLERIRLMYSPVQLPVIMVTALDRSEHVVKALELGANDYVVKPLDLGVVAARVNTQISLNLSFQRIVELERRLGLQNAELQKANALLVETAERTHRELLTAAKVQESFFPSSLPKIAGLEFAWTVKPCQELAGDSLNICPFNEEDVGLYVLDVSGHGVAASLLAVAAARVLSPTRNSDSILMRNRAETDPGQPVSPAEVADRLNRSFKSNTPTEHFLTFFYMILNARTRMLRYVTAGHPAAIRVGRDAGAWVLEGTDLPIGVGESYHERSATLEPGDRVYLYSDGVTEAQSPQRELFGLEQLKSCLSRGKALELNKSVDLILEEIDTWRGGKPAEDDVSILAVECAP